MKMHHALHFHYSMICSLNYKIWYYSSIQEVRYYISSLEPYAERLATSIRTHWSIENSLHWVLDVALLEDDCRIRTDHAPENFTLLRHLAISALNQEKTAKLGIKNKQRRAGWDDDYLLKILEG